VEGEIKLKKNYNAFMIRISIVIFLVFLVGVSEITYYKAVAIRGKLFEEINYNFENLNDISHYYLLYNENADHQKDLKEALAKYDYDKYGHQFSSQKGHTLTVEGKDGPINYYIDRPELFAYETYAEMCIDNDIGFYSMLKSSDGKILAQYQNFLMISLTYNNGHLDVEPFNDRKILILKDNYSDELTKRMTEYLNDFDAGILSGTMEGTYDDIFLYPTKLTLYKDQEEVKETKEFIPDIKNNIGDTEISNWVKDNCLSIGETCVDESIFDTKKNTKLYREAVSLCNKFYNSITDFDTWKNSPSTYSDNIFTSYNGDIGYIDSNHLAAAPYIFVFHPVSLAMKALISVYLFAFLLYCVILIMLYKLIQKLKIQQISFENNRKELVRAIAHELKTPLGIINSYTESLTDLSEDNKKEYTSIIINEVQHMDKLIQDMLELSRLEANAKTLTYEEVELVSLTHSIFRRFDSVIKEQNITLKFDTPPEVIISADLVGIQTVLLNYITNAVKHARSLISISIQADEKSVTFNIVNDGNHILSRHINKVWDSFYKEDEARGHQFGSIGLGLSITKNILELHKMQYGCENIEGGVRFWFRVKL